MFNNHCIEILHFYGDCFPTEQQIKQRIRSLSYHLNIEQSFVYEIVIDDIHLDKIPESDICTISSTIVNKTQKIFKDTLNQYKDNQPTLNVLLESSQYNLTTLKNFLQFIDKKIIYFKNKNKVKQVGIEVNGTFVGLYHNVKDVLPKNLEYESPVLQDRDEIFFYPKYF